MKVALVHPSCEPFSTGQDRCQRPNGFTRKGTLMKIVTFHFIAASWSNLRIYFLAFTFSTKFRQENIFSKCKHYQRPVPALLEWGRTPSFINFLSMSTRPSLYVLTALNLGKGSVSNILTKDAPKTALPT